MTYQKWAWLGMVVLLGGCGFRAVGKNDMGGMGGAGGTGGAGGSGGSGGAGGTGGSGGSGGAGGSGGGDMAVVDNSCALPQLLVATSNLTNGGGAGGEVVRLSLSTGTPTPCSTLKGQGLIGAEVWSVGYLAPNFVAASTPTDVYLVDATRDVIVWDKRAPQSSTSSPLDVFVLQDGSGSAAIDFAFGEVTNPTDYYVTEIDGYHSDGSMAANTPLCTSGCMYPLNVTTTTPSVFGNPKSPTHLLTVDMTNNVAAWDVNPSGPSKTQYVAGNGDYLITIYAVKVGATTRVAWLNATSNQPTSVDWVNDPGSGTPTLSGPLRCSNGCSSIAHVVPDPTAQDAFFLLCDGATQSKRSIVRLKTDGSCAPVFDGATLGDNFALQRLALAQ